MAHLSADRLEMLEQENRELREEIRLLRNVIDGNHDRRRLMVEPQPGRVDAARIIVFEDQSKGGWCWSARDTNGEEVASSGDDGYVERGTAMKAARDLFPAAEVVEMGSSAGELD